MSKRLPADDPDATIEIQVGEAWERAAHVAAETNEAARIEFVEEPEPAELPLANLALYTVLTLAAGGVFAFFLYSLTGEQPIGSQATASTATAAQVGASFGLLGAALGVAAAISAMLGADGRRKALLGCAVAVAAGAVPLLAYGPDFPPLGLPVLAGVLNASMTWRDRRAS